MKKFWNTLKWIGGSLLTLIVVSLLFVGVAVAMTALESNHKEQAYAEGQVDVLTSNVKYVRLAEEAESESEKDRKRAYAMGADDAQAGDVRVRAVNDSTYVWTVSPWGKDKKVPTDTINIKR